MLLINIYIRNKRQILVKQEMPNPTVTLPSRYWDRASLETIIDTYTPHKVRVSEGIDVSFPETGHNYPQSRLVIAGESISPGSKAQSPTKLNISSN